MFDYDSYGAFKGSMMQGRHAVLKRLARWLGLRHRYLQFLDGAPRDPPLLEIGCGDGTFLRELIDHGFQRVLGVEPSGSYTSVVDERPVVRGYANEFLGDAPSGSIATVVALDVFEHIPATQLKELLLLLGDRVATDGRVVMRIPNMSGALGMFNYFGDVSHVSGLNEVSLRQLAHGTPFGDVKFYAEPFAYPRSLRSLVGIAL